jgi:hypothetical protein
MTTQPSDPRAALLRATDIATDAELAALRLKAEGSTEGWRDLCKVLWRDRTSFARALAAAEAERDAAKNAVALGEQALAYAERALKMCNAEGRMFLDLSALPGCTADFRRACAAAPRSEPGAG